jgi:hypothetical protein
MTSLTGGSASFLLPTRPRQADAPNSHVAHLHAPQPRRSETGFRNRMTETRGSEFWRRANSDERVQPAPAEVVGGGQGDPDGEERGRIASIWGTAPLSVSGARTMDRIAPSGPTKNWVGSPNSRYRRKMCPDRSAATV